MRVLHHRLWRWTDAGIAISEAIRQFAITVEGAPEQRMHTIHYGLNPASVQAPTGARAELCEQLDLPPDVLIIGSVCRLIEQKGLIYGLRGFAQIVDQFPEAHYVIAGDGPLRAALESDTRALGIDAKVHFIGWRNDPYTIMAALDVFLAPSLWEGFGLVFLEAMALCVPIISTRVSAIPEVVEDGVTGWLIPPADADAIAQTLAETLAHPMLLRERGNRGRQRLEREFTTETMIERTLALYRGLEANG
jgi:glycosyltransferase involved in cell wall biosynthesis